jgi:hypothetical protein
MEEMF